MDSAGFWYTASPFFGPMGTATMVLVLFGIFYVGLWWKDRDPGTQWLALSILVAACFYGAESLGLVAPPSTVMGPRLAVVTVATASILFSVGLCMFVDPLNWFRSVSMYIAIAPMALLLVAMLFNVQIPRVSGNWLWVVPYLVLASVVWRARASAPGAGYELLAASLLVLPAGLSLLVSLDMDVVFLRYVSLLSRVLVAMTLLVVLLHRRRTRLEAELERRRAVEQALQVANAVLEKKVAERTADLQDMVAGLESFNRNVSHDLRGPLGGIAGVAQLAVKHIDRNDLGRARRMLTLVERQAMHAEDLVAALLEMARIGHVPLQRSTVALDGILDSVIEELGSRPDAGPVPVVHVHAVPSVLADPTLVRAVYTNLLSNAFKFLRGRPAPRVDAGAETQGGDVVFYVRDNGPGFDAQVAESLFEPFKRLHGADVEGHGIGLSIVRRAVERHGGRVWAEASPGAGATFYFTLSTRNS
jgi:signal transduction histidine kinase